MPPPQELAQREPVPVGETISDAGVTLTVLSAERTNSFEGATADPGQTFLIVEIRLENNSEDTVQTAGGFRLVDNTGNEYTRDLGLDPSEVEFGFLAIGSTTEGRLPFIIPEASTDLMLIYEPMEFMMWDVAPFRIAIDETAPGAEAPAASADAPPAGAQVATVTSGGNFRSEARVAPDTVLGQVCVDDQVEILEEQSGWYRVRVFATAGDCVPQRVGAGTEGWISGTLLSQPTAYTPPDQPAPAEEPTEAPAAEPTAEPTEAPTAEPTEEPTPALVEEPTATPAEEATEEPTAEPTTEQTDLPPDTPIGTVNNGGNLRSDTVFADDTVIAQVCPGDQVAILEERNAEEILWYRIRVTELAADCHPERAALDTEGWLSSILVDR
jgi:hypothetical protein